MLKPRTSQLRLIAVSLLLFIALGSLSGCAPKEESTAKVIPSGTVISGFPAIQLGDKRVEDAPFRAVDDETLICTGYLEDGFYQNLDGKTHYMEISVVVRKEIDGAPYAEAISFKLDGTYLDKESSPGHLNKDYIQETTVGTPQKPGPTKAGSLVEVRFKAIDQVGFVASDVKILKTFEEILLENTVDFGAPQDCSSLNPDRMPPQASSTWIDLKGAAANTFVTQDFLGRFSGITYSNDGAEGALDIEQSRLYLSSVISFNLSGVFDAKDEDLSLEANTTQQDQDSSNEQKFSLVLKNKRFWLLGIGN